MPIPNATILLLTEVFPPQTGGSGRWLWEVYRRFPREEAVVAAGACPRAEEFDRTHDLRVVRVPLTLRTWGIAGVRASLDYWKAFRRVRRLVRSHQVEQVHCGGCLPEGWIAWLMRKLGGPRYAVYVHGEELPLGAASRELGWMMRRVLRGADFVVANSRNTAGMLRSGWPVRPERLHVLHPGVDAGVFVPAEPSEPVRRELGWQGRTVILTVGRLQKRKGQDMLIRALPRIAAAAPDVLYAIAGDGEERGRLEALAAEVGVADRVQFLGEVTDELLIKCYQQCDLFVLPNRTDDGDFEGFGMVLLEAQACGKAVVAGASGGTAETMDVGRTGYVVPCDSPEPVADLLCELLLDRERRERMGTSAREWVLSRFDWPALVEQARQIFGMSELADKQNGCARVPELGTKLARQGSTTRAACEPIVVPLEIDTGLGWQDGLQPVSVVVWLPQGVICGEAVGRVRGAAFGELPAQTAPLTVWPDGSVEHLLVDFLLPSSVASVAEAARFDEGTQAACPTSGRKLAAEVAISERHFEERADRNGSHRAENCVTIREIGEAVLIDTGSMRFQLQRRDGAPMPAMRLTLTDRRGRLHAPRWDEMWVEARGPVRATVVLEGRFRRVSLRVKMRLSFFAGGGLVRAEVTLHNPRRARHRGGLWDLGDAGSVLFRDFTVEAPWDGNRPTIFFRTQRGEALRQSQGDFLEIYQDSSGGEHWQSDNHVNRQGRLPLRFRGYRVRSSADATAGSAGLRAEPTVRLQNRERAVAVAVPNFWQQFPKAIEADTGGLRVRLFPRQFADLHELQGGEQKTHTVWFDFGSATSGDEQLDWVHAPAVVRASLKTPTMNTIASLANPPCGTALERLDALLKEALEGPQSLFAKIEQVDEYGWRNFGDIYADHEEQHYGGPRPLVSHYNNQFDMLYGFLLHFLRTGDRRWFELGDALARHVIDVDVYHTRRDRAAYNGGLFWFTDHYLHAHTATHRTYSRANRPKGGGPYGGGPGAEHNFTTGLLLYYQLTGNPLARAAVVGLAEWVIAMDDGRRNILGVLDSGPTGRATGTAGVNYHPLGRAAGNSINALLDAWKLTQEAKYLQYAEALISRCIHPTDDVAARNLLDVEKRWSYTVFLASLAKYLDSKAEAEQIDPMYAYAQASLLSYGRWMVDHERPYFDQAEKLEYPTEAWAAQEFRKVNVMRRAACHADEPLRTKLYDRGDELAERAWQDLLRFETRATARALAIVMVEGLWDCLLRQRGIAPMPRVVVSTGLGLRQEFVPQRLRVFSRARTVSGAMSIAVRLLNPLSWARYQRQRSLLA